MTYLRYILPLLALCVTACTFDFTDVTDPPRDTPATLQVQIVARTQADRLLLSAHLSPGLDTDGNVRSVITDLLVAGRAIASSALGEGILTYGAALSLSDELPAGGSLAVRAPGIDGLQPMTEQTFEIPVPVQPGPDSLFVNDGDSVVLHIAARPIVAAPQAQWWLALTDSAGGHHVMIQALGYPPEQIVLPRSLFSPASSMHTVTLDIHQSFSSEIVPGRYIWAALVRAQHSWTIVFE